MKSKDLNSLRSESFSKGQRVKLDEIEQLLVSEIRKRARQLRRGVFSDKDVKLK